MAHNHENSASVAISAADVGWETLAECPQGGVLAIAHIGRVAAV